MNSERGRFGSQLGVILASAGSAVGLGNIWRFPTEVGKGGGAAFILIYLGFIFLIAMPVMISEKARMPAKTAVRGRSLRRPYFDRR